jgi:hypothetical protein
MHVGVQHRITDPEKFFSADAEAAAENAPAGIHARQFYLSQDKSTAVCLWEADSIGAARSYIDGITEGASENTYFEVNAEYATGLPEAAAARA